MAGKRFECHKPPPKDLDPTASRVLHHRQEIAIRIPKPGDLRAFRCRENPSRIVGETYESFETDSALPQQFHDRSQVWDRKTQNRVGRRLRCRHGRYAKVAAANIIDQRAVRFTLERQAQYTAVKFLRLVNARGPNDRLQRGGCEHGDSLPAAQKTKPRSCTESARHLKKRKSRDERGLRWVNLRFAAGERQAPD